ncbi:hypothetical protein [Flexivirga oryzae]|uniref:Uncharacterized protein n=1 Tax=Flexivirga oryzae TaxID=1794944 RepID=A0A839N9I6_9MICO|nr:hypothetical protein [Flexivirga oryzae]MBB2893887.1 hypothetical protein [Flexivirga oryzae]
MGRRAWLVAAAAGAVALSGCGGGDGADPLPPTTKDGSLGTALIYLPVGSTSVEFGDSSPWMIAHGFSRGEDGDLSKDDRFLKALQNASFTESGLWTYFRAMDDWGWSALDIDWSATATDARTEKMVHYVQFLSGVKISTIETSLIDHGYTAKGHRFTAPSLKTVHDDTDYGLLLSIGRNVRFYPDKHLMVSSNTVTDLELPSDAKSLANDRAVRQVVAPIKTADYVSITTGSGACITPRNSTPAQLKQLGPLGTVSATAAAVLNDNKSIATVSYPSEDAATSDLPHRKALLAQKSLVNNEPYQSIAHFALTRKGPTIRYTIGGRPLLVPQMLHTGDAPWAMCAPKGGGTASATS